MPKDNPTPPPPNKGEGEKRKRDGGAEQMSKKESSKGNKSQGTNSVRLHASTITTFSTVSSSRVKCYQKGEIEMN